MNESLVFANALELATPAERAAYLDEACAGNSQLRAGVEALLQAHANDPGFLTSDGKRLASANGGLDALGWPLLGEVKVWDAETGQEVRAFLGHTHAVLSVCFSPDGKRLASASQDQTVKVWEAQKNGGFTK